VPSRRSRALTAVALGIACLGPAAVSATTTRADAYQAPAHSFATPSDGHPDVYTWQGVALESPVAESQISGTDITTACDPTGTRLCEDTKLTVPSGLHASTLYLKVAWHHPVWKLFMYAVEPDGTTVHGGALGCDSDSYAKGCGNETTLPFDEVTIPDPKPGTWTIRVAAVHSHGEAYTGTASLTASSPLTSLRESLDQLTAHLTRNQRVNVVFAGWQPTQAELADLKDNSTTQYRISVAEKQSADCINNNTGQVAGLVQGVNCDYTGTDPRLDAGQSGNSAVPYFEPLQFDFDYHYLVADDTYTKDLFARMQKATQVGAQFGTGRVPFTSAQAPFKQAYLTKYNAEFGQFRGQSHLVTDTTTVDLVDGFKVEDWIQSTRFDARYGSSFRDLATNRTEGAQFVNPEPTAAQDIHWDGNGKHAADVDHDPQGVNTGLTFFLVDTFSPAFADQYFRPDHYHAWTALNDITDPDTGGPAGPDNGRGWGGRYRFYLLDLGAAPSSYERSDWVSANVNPEDGSAFFDPPVWQWQNDPNWNGTNPMNGASLTVVENGVSTQVPYHYAGDTLGQVLGFELTTGLSFKFIGGFLYRPIPNDVYIINTLQVTDHYSLPPAQGGQDLYSVDLSKVYQPAVGIKALSSAAPYAYFSPSFVKYITLGCASRRFVLDIRQEVSDPSCTSPDGLQQAIEDGKANGLGEVVNLPISGVSVPDYAVNVNPIRDYIDSHRAQYAPLVDGAFSVPVFNVMFEKQFNAALPLLVGGIALPVNGGEGWGQLDNVNDDLIPQKAVDCNNSAPGACVTLAANPQHHDYYLTYVVTHEAAHFLGLNHPHDGAQPVTKASDGSWTKYYTTLKWLYDISASPTTYAGDYNQYEDIDQDRLMYGHAAEYMRQAQDWIADAYWTDGAAGRTSASGNTQIRERTMRMYRDLSSSLFKGGDYLHSQYAMKDAMLYAKGVFDKPVTPHRLNLDEAAHDRNAIFAIHPAAAHDPDSAGTTLANTASVPGAPLTAGLPTQLPNTATGAPGSLGPGFAVAFVGIGAALLAWRRRRGVA
jgi:hypothetical protein